MAQIPLDKNQNTNCNESATKDSKIDTYLSLNPSRFNIWDSIEIKRDLTNAASNGCDITIGLASSLLSNSDNKDSAQRLILEFTGARNINFGDLEVLGGCMPTITNVKNRQWEEINYHVMDAEQEGRIAFYCHSFTARLESR